MGDVTDNEHRQSVQASFVLLYRHHVEERLRGMFMAPVSGIEYGRGSVLGKPMRTCPMRNGE